MMGAAAGDGTRDARLNRTSPQQERSTRVKAVFLVAPKDIQESRLYEEALSGLGRLHPEDEVVPDRSLFADTADWRRRWTGIFDLADVLYVLPREDMTVGLGVFKEWRRLSSKGVPCFRLDPGPFEGIPPTLRADARFSLEKTGRRIEDGVEAAGAEEGFGLKGTALDFRRFARVERPAHAAQAGAEEASVLAGGSAGVGAGVAARG